MVRNFPNGLRPPTRVTVALALSASLLCVASTSSTPSAASDDHSDLHHRKHRLEQAIDVQSADVDEVSTRLLRVKDRLDGAVNDLVDARAALAAIRVKVRAAARTDRQMQRRLALAQTRLSDAQADLTEGRVDVQENRATLAAYAVSTYQSGGSFGLGIAFESDSLHDALDSLQATDTVLNRQSVALQEVQAARVLLRLTVERVEQAKQAVSEQRAIAAENLHSKRELETHAKTAKLAVVTRLTTLREIRGDMSTAKQAEIHRLQTLKRERDRVEERLRKLAERRARQHARELAKARRLQQAASVDDGFLSSPVRNTYITSSYGMRVHPILHVLKLHDGTDFHAGCGTPVYAAADGRVLSAYFNVGYGNRIIVDHGFVRGVSLTTSYNHLMSFVAGAGERVERGELIAYSGTTGYSTACHLHFMVDVNGHSVDPARWL